MRYTIQRTQADELVWPLTPAKPKRNLGDPDCGYCAGVFPCAMHQPEQFNPPLNLPK